MISTATYIQEAKLKYVYEGTYTAVAMSNLCILELSSNNGFMQHKFTALKQISVLRESTCAGDHFDIFSLKIGCVVLEL